jgi:hypothetical protein
MKKDIKYITDLLQKNFTKLLQNKEVKMSACKNVNDEVYYSYYAARDSWEVWVKVHKVEVRVISGGGYEEDTINIDIYTDEEGYTSFWVNEYFTLEYRIAK